MNLVLLALVFGPTKSGHVVLAQGGPITVLAREGRRTLPTIELQGHQMVGLDDLAGLFQLQVREDAAARAITATYKGQTIVMTPDQSLVSSSGRLVSLPAPLTRRNNRWLVPLEFISRALAPIYDVKLDLRPVSRLLVLGDLRVPRVTAQYDDSPSLLRVTLETTPRATATVAQEQGRLLVRVDADALDAALPSPPPQQLLTGIRVVDPNTIQLDLGPRFSAFRASPPVSSGAAALVTIELVGTGVDTSSMHPPLLLAELRRTSLAHPLAPGAAAPGAPVAPDGALPVFGGATRPTIRTIVIDPGHGGDDGGVKGAGGALEKDVALAVARRLKGAIEGRLGMRALLTREGNRVDADGRAAIANNNKADLFISLHANGSPRATLRGTVIYTLSLDRVGEDARRQSEADRAVLQVFGGGAREVGLVEWELAQAAHLDGSNAFAGIVDQKLRTTAGLPSVALQRAPIRNLAGTNMPAVLIEMGYLSNAEEEKLLTSSEFQNSIALALTEAVAAFRDHVEQEPQPPAAP